MDATFLAKIKSDYPELNLKKGKRFAFRPPHTITYTDSLTSLEKPILKTASSHAASDTDVNFSKNALCLLFLHELGHFLIKKNTFKTEIGRLKIEVLAWEKAKSLCPRYQVKIDEDLIERELDTYRDWLHTKSTCRNCGLTRFETPDGVFHCPRCDVL